ncbi:HK97 family phage prohead protease [Nonomuraea sp. NPDC050786]|uniref:HK97 family phage prohead protease n=1 Tax=Nonomuraea sp. NPDC050786 TaxID=3154840 RepID=UPI0034053BC8
MEPLRDLTLVRAVRAPVRVARADDDPMPTMTLRFAPFNVWYEIDSWWEGRFLERMVPGAFSKTIAERADQVKIMFNHGRDFHIHQKLLGVPARLVEEDDSPVAEVPLFDTSYNRDLLPGLEAAAYGSSFMFHVLQHTWNEEPGVSEHNPEGLPERSVTEVRLLETGPVTWPANPSASAGVRSLTDDWYEHLRTVDPSHVERLTARVTELRTAAAAQPPHGTGQRQAAASEQPHEPAAGHSGGLTPRERRWRRYPYLNRKEGVR